MIGWSKMNERSHDMIQNRMLLDVRVSPRKQRYKKHPILIKLLRENKICPGLYVVEV